MPAIAHRLALAALAALLGAGCLRGDPDPLVELCTEVIHYRHPSLESVKIVDVERDAAAAAVTLAFEAKTQLENTRVSNHISCDFDDSERLESIRIGGRDLTEAEVALVNSEFLLRELGRDAEPSRSWF